MNPKSNLMQRFPNHRAASRSADDSQLWETGGRALAQPAELATHRAVNPHRTAVCFAAR
jgi:hypothetical protein